jgi:GT2 family glycosyltransferase
MRIDVVLIAYALDLRPLINSLSGPDTYFHIYTHSQRSEARAVMQLMAEYRPDLTIHDYGTNRGLSTSWNDGVIEAQAESADAVLIINDDIAMSRTDMLQMAQCCVDHREAGIVVVTGENIRMQGHLDLGYSAFGINPIATETIGYLDENYWPIYGEDVDYSRRLALTGIPIVSAGDTGIVHQGSQTIAVVPELRGQNHITFPRNQLYHAAKHGGIYGHETFQYPFGDPQLSWKIEAESRHNPYPAHQRQDKDVAKI